MVNVIPTIIFDALLAGAAVALFGATLRSMAPRGSVRRGVWRWRAPWARQRRHPLVVTLRPALGRVEPLATRRQALTRRAS